MLKRLLLKEVNSPLEGDTQSMPLYKAIFYLAIPFGLIAFSTLAVLI